MARYGLAIDLSRCTGCYACMIACKSENSTLPGVLWIRIEEKEEGEFPKVSKTWIPMLCMQCAEMPCAQVCPTGAITRGEGGIVLIDSQSCICEGVKPCVSACPFGVLLVNQGNRSYFRDYLTPHEKQDYEAHAEGAVEKCDLCHHRVIAGMQPSCVQACPSKAMLFGDLDEPASDLVQLVSSKEAKALRDDLKLDPSVFYVNKSPAEAENETPLAGGQST